MQLTIRLPDEQMNRINQIAKQMGLKKSDITRIALKQFIDQHSETTEKPFVKVKHLLGIAESGVSDLGQRHREHLLKRIRNADK